MSQSLKQAWIKVASLYWLGYVINLRKGVAVAGVVVVLSPPAAAEAGGRVAVVAGRRENLLSSRRGFVPGGPHVFFEAARCGSKRVLSH